MTSRHVALSGLLIAAPGVMQAAPSRKPSALDWILFMILWWRGGGSYQTLPLRGRQGVCGSKAENSWRLVHSIGWLRGIFGNPYSNLQMSAMLLIPLSSRGAILVKCRQYPHEVGAQDTCPTGKIYVGKGSIGSARYMGSPEMSIVSADFEALPEGIRRDCTLRKEILWESSTAAESELSAMEV